PPDRPGFPCALPPDPCHLFLAEISPTRHADPPPARRATHLFAAFDPNVQGALDAQGAARHAPYDIIVKSATFEQAFWLTA
ncbi:MAG: hypothetical protein N3A38_07800, partial [Planctomycetota bacterium]|nr:hypothetical protein [Planctomycetota bacterium]